MSECANLFCRNVYRNVSKHNNIALTLCWKTTKKYKAQYVLFDQPARRPVSQSRRGTLLAVHLWIPVVHLPENVVPFPFF